jgi:hypothetical protein
VQRSALSFAGGRARRPYPKKPAAVGFGDAPDARASGQRGTLVAGVKAPDDVDVSGRRIVTRVRQGVSEPIGLGQSFHRERSRWLEPTRDLRVSARPLTREVSTGLLTQVGSAIRSSAHRRKVVSAESEAAPAGDRGCGAAELGRSWSCSRIATGAEVDRRRAAPLATCEERVDHEQGSSLAARERCPGERTPEAGSSWQSGENGGGLSFYRVEKRESASRHLGAGKRASALHGAPVDGRRLGSRSPFSFDERAGEPILVTEGSRATADRRDDRGRQRSLAQHHRRRKRSDGAAARKGSPTQRSSKGFRGGSPCREEPKLDLRRQAQANRGRIAARRSGATQENRSSGRGSGARKRGRTFAPMEGKHLRGRRGESRVLGSRAIRGCSCRESVAEVGEKHLPLAPRGEPRGKPRGRGVARAFWLVPRTRPSRWVRAKGCEERRANVTGIARLLTRPQGRGSNRWKASWARPGVTSNRVASSRVLAW